MEESTTAGQVTPADPDISVVMEDDVIVDDVENFPNAVAVFFGLHYILNREYAGGKCSHMFQCLQTILPAPAGHRQGQNVTQSTVAEHKIFPSNFI